MGTDDTGLITEYAGLGVLDPRMRDPSSSIWSAESTYTEEGARPGDPVPGSSSVEMRIEASGTMSTATDLYAVASGMPGPSDTGAQVVYKASTDGATAYRGRDVPSVITKFDFISYDADSDPGKLYPHAVTLSDGRIVCAYQVDASSGSDAVAIQYRDPGSAWSAKINVYTQDAGSTALDGHLLPCLIKLPDDRLLVFFFVAADTGYTQVRMYRSSDKGATWSIGSANCLIDPLQDSAYTSQRLRGAYSPLTGNIMILMDLKDNTATNTNTSLIRQLASDNLGTSLTTIDTSTHSVRDECGAYADVVWRDGVFLTARLGIPATGTISGVRMTSTASAFVSCLYAYQTAISAGVGFATVNNSGGTQNKFLSAGDLALVLDDDGVFYIYVVRLPGTNGEGIVLRGTQIWGRFNTVTDLPYMGVSGGDTWGKWYDTATATVYPKNFCATYQSGRIALIHNIATGGHAHDGSLCVSWLGGPTKITMPQATSVKTDKNQATWDQTWIPLDIPNQMDWTATATGDPGVIDASNFLTLSPSGVGFNLYYTKTYDFDSSGPGIANINVIGRFCVKMVDRAGGTSSDLVFYRFAIEDDTGNENYDISFRLKDDAIRAYNNADSSYVSASTAIDFETNFVEVIYGWVRTGTRVSSLYAWYRIDSGQGAARDWISFIAETSVAGGTYSGSNHRITHKFGNTGERDTSYWRFVGFNSNHMDYREGDGSTGGEISQSTVYDKGWAQAYTNPGDLFGRQVTAFPAFINDDTQIRAIDGPAFVGDTWAIPVAADYGIKKMFPTFEPSPRRSWRSTSKADTTIALSLDSTILDAADSLPFTDGLVLGLFNANMTTAVWEYQTASGSWTTLATVNKFIGSLSFERVGNVIHANTDTGSQPYFQQNELAGAWFAFDASGTNMRKIVSNSEGQFRSVDDTMRIRIVLDGVTNSEGTTGTAGVIVFPNAVTVVPMDNDEITGLRLKITASSSYAFDGYYEIGTMFVGYLQAFGQVPALGRNVDVVGNAETFISRDRSGVRTRQDSGSYRIHEIPFSDLMPTADVTTDVEATPANGVEYFRMYGSASYAPIASKRGTPFVLESLPDMTRGGRDPVIYIPRIELMNTATTYLIGHHRQFCYGLIEPRARKEYVIQTKTGESVRVPVVKLTEII